jgi:glutathione synthase/RimK-type ligase-like ATP-grasp enzyme
MILVWGVADPPARAVLDALMRAGESAFYLDQRDALETELTLELDRRTKGTLRSKGEIVKLDAIGAAYIRPMDAGKLAAAEGSARAAALDEAMLCWSETTHAFLVNRPSSMASNNSKPYQLRVIHDHGFAVPETLLTTDTAALEEFWECHGEVIYKSISGVRSIVGRLTPAHRARFAQLSSCPTQFQQWIAGTDFRVHVVGTDVFATEIESSAIDYRYPSCDGELPRLRAVDISPDLAHRCVRLAGALGLPFAGIDLRRTPAGEWYCFEVNPSPGFTFYAEATGQPIAGAVASLLASASRERATQP